MKRSLFFWRGGRVRSASLCSVAACVCIARTFRFFPAELADLPCISIGC